MAKVTTLQDDVTGRMGAKANVVVINGVAYEIDLQKSTFNTLLGPIVEKGRRISVKSAQKRAREVSQ